MTRSSSLWAPRSLCRSLSAARVTSAAGTIAPMPRGSAWEVDVGCGSADGPGFGVGGRCLVGSAEGEAPVADARCASPRATEGWSLPSGATGDPQANGALACAATSQVTRLRLPQRECRFRSSRQQRPLRVVQLPKGATTLQLPGVRRIEQPPLALRHRRCQTPHRPPTPNPGVSTQSSRSDVTAVSVMLTALLNEALLPDNRGCGATYA